MTIAYISDAIYPYNKGGKEKRLYELSTRLAAMGHDVHIYCMQWWQGSKDRTENGVHLHAISKFYKLYSNDRRSIWQGVMFGLACLKLFRVKFDVVDVDHMPLFPIYSVWFVCLLRRRKLYGTWHESLTRKDWTDYMGSAGLVGSVIESASIRLPDHITAGSDHTRELLIANHHRSKRIDVVASGIDSKLLNGLDPAAITCDVLYCGRLVKDKNVDKLVRAVALIAPDNPEFRCTIVGHGIEKAHLVELIKQLKLTELINVLDPLPNAQDIYAYMKAAKVFCLPSVREGFGIVVLESLGCGTPVVTIDSPANAARDLIQDGKNGSIVALNPQAIAGAITYWTSRPKPANLARQAAKRDWNDLALKQAEVYAS
jgi:glycosyltransferase involved in cell wall biosynthesis